MQRWMLAAALAMACARAHDRPPAGPDDAAIGATAGDASSPDAAPGDAQQVAMPDACAWWCGLTGTVNLTYEVSEADCEYDFADGASSKGSAGMAIVVTGTAPDGLIADMKMAGLDFGTVPVEPDGTWTLSLDTGVSTTEAEGRIDGLTMTASVVHDETDYDLSCPHMTGAAP